MSSPTLFPSSPRWLPGHHLFWPREQWEALQQTELTAHLRHALTTPFYHSQNLSSTTPFTSLPLTTKSDLGAAGSVAYGVPLADVREWVTTSGTSGRPLSIPLAASDLQRLAANEAVALSIAGLQQGDTALLAVGMDRLFVAGLAYWLGAQTLGAACLRAGPQHAASPSLLSELFERYQPTHIIAVPSLLTGHITPCGSTNGALAHTLRGIICIGEPIRSPSGTLNALGQRVQDRFSSQTLVPILSTYACTETCTTFAEGPLCRGGHLNPQMGLIEMLDESGRPVPANTPGEIVVTPLGVRAFPLLRFATGDIAVLDEAPCPCGRTTPRLGPVLGRKNQLLKVRGTSLFPAAIADALAAIPHVQDHALIVEQDHALSDRLTLHVHLNADSPQIRHQLETQLGATLKVLPEMIYTDPTALAALHFSTNSRKPQRFIDRRSHPREL